MRIQYLFPNIRSGTMSMSCGAQILLFLTMFLFSKHFYAFILLSLLQQLVAVTIFHDSSLCDSQSFHSRIESTFKADKFAFSFFYFLINCFILYLRFRALHMSVHFIFFDLNFSVLSLFSLRRAPNSLLHIYFLFICTFRQFSADESNFQNLLYSSEYFVLSLSFNII